MHNRNEAVKHITKYIVVLIEVTKICFYNREILETTFSAIALTLLLREICLKCTYSRGRWLLSEYCLIFNEPYDCMRCLFCKDSCIYLKSKKNGFCFIFTKAKCPKWPKQPARENSFHANSIKTLPNIIKCWLLISDWCCCSIRTNAGCLGTYWKINYSPPPLTNISNSHI